MKDILVVDDDSAIVRVTSQYLEKQGFGLAACGNGSDALELLRERPFDVLLTDLAMPGLDGIALLAEARSLYPDLVAIVMTGHASIDTAIEAMRHGASDYLPKPFTLPQLKIAVDRALDYHDLKSENVRLRRELKERYSFKNIVGSSEPMRRVYALLEKVAPVDSTVLIHGESGVGKELIVRALHYQHPRRKDGPLVTVHCGAIPSELIESELFGHTRGAFTGADRDRQGKFELADGGTIFLDEIGTMRSDLQVKLLRVLQERHVSRVGSSEPIGIDVRVIAATNENLRAQVDRGAFRRDLFYRLNVIPVLVPPLRARRSDIPLLARHFVDQACQVNRLAAKELSQGVMKVLMSYAWPGNVRQLENTMEYAAVISGPRTRVLEEDLPAEIEVPAAGAAASLAVTEEGLDLRAALSDIERDLIHQSLDLAGGNKARAAGLLRMKRTTFVEKLKRLETE